MTIILSNLNRFKNFLTGRFLGKFAVKCIFKIPPHFEYVATLPRETLSAKQAINNKLQGSVATYLRCDGVVINEIKKSLLLGLRVKKILKSVNIWQSYSKNVIVSCTLHTWPTHSQKTELWS